MTDFHSILRDGQEILESLKSSFVFLARFKMAAPGCLHGGKKRKKKVEKRLIFVVKLRSDDTSLDLPLLFLLSDDRKCHYDIPEVMEE